MPDRWDLAVIGSGPAGRAAIRRARELGLHALLVSPALPISDDTAAAVVRGRARLTGPDRLEVETASGVVDHQATAIVLATGTRPARLAGVEPDGRRIRYATRDEGPMPPGESLVILGGGPTGLALAAAAAGAGRPVTLVEIRDHLLPGFDPDLGADLTARLADGGATILTGHRAARIVARPGDVQVTLRRADDRQAVEVQADGAVVAVGRRPRTRDLGLEAVGVLTDRLGFVQTDAVMATTRAGIYAVGGIVPTGGGVDSAVREAFTAVDHLAGRETEPLRYDRIPSFFTSGVPILAVGLGEPAALAAGHLIGTGRTNLPGETAGWIKVVADAETGEILGVHGVGAAAAAARAWAPALIAAGPEASPAVDESESEPAAALHRAVNLARREGAA